MCRPEFRKQAHNVEKFIEENSNITNLWRHTLEPAYFFRYYKLYSDAFDKGIVVYKLSIQVNALRVISSSFPFV